MQDGVLLANPARVVAVVTLIRQHMVQTHTLRLSSAEREEKTAALYAFITSERCAQLLDRIEKQAEDLLELQNKEMRWHKNDWEKQGEAYPGDPEGKGRSRQRHSRHHRHRVPKTLPELEETEL